LNFDVFTIEIFAIKPCDCTLSGGRVIIRYGSFTFLFSGITMCVNPDLWFSSFFVVFDYTN